MIDRIAEVKWKIWQSGKTIKAVATECGYCYKSIYAGMNGLCISEKRLRKLEQQIIEQ
jgi:hypothetical protein